jgi:hypothetical protein
MTPSSQMSSINNMTALQVDIKELREPSESMLIMHPIFLLAFGNTWDFAKSEDCESEPSRSGASDVPAIPVS